MMKIIVAGAALLLMVAGAPVFAANDCSDCSAPASVASPSSRDVIRAARSSDAKRIAEEPVGRPWDGMKLVAPKPKPDVVK